MRRKLLFGMAVVVLLSASLSCCSPSSITQGPHQVMPPPAPAPAAAENCPAPPEWFAAGGTPKPLNQKPNPDSDCEFYQWAWQSFLYVTQPENKSGDQLRLLGFKTPEDIFPPASTPRFPRTSAGLRLAPRLAKEPEAVALQEFLQADSRGVLIDQDGRNIYYAQHMNGEFVSFVDDPRNQFRNVDNIAKAPADLEIPRGTLELKSSWKVLGPHDDKSKFFTTQASVAVLKLVGGKPTIDATQTRQETMALVGLHVVGVVDGHPEFIWATFEHNDNTPDLPNGANPVGTQPVDDTRSYTFYPRGTPAADCNRKKALKFKSEADQTFDTTVPIFREFPFGAATETEVDPAIRTLNENVHAMIEKLAPRLATWKNYRLTGAVWLNDPAAKFRENSDFADEDAKHPELKILGGETRLSNTTMETFTQAVKVNCFNCHRTTGEAGGGIQFPPKRIAVSHILTNAYINAKQAPPH